jgi:hypothetical protein
MFISLFQDSIAATLLELNPELFIIPRIIHFTPIDAAYSRANRHNLLDDCTFIKWNVAVTIAKAAMEPDGNWSLE